MPSTIADAPGAGRASPRFVLGTAQLGTAYGIANTAGCPSESAAVALVHAALRCGVQDFDTARAYGQAEHRLGLALGDVAAPSPRIVTKLSPLIGIEADAAPAHAVAQARASLGESRLALRRHRLDSLLLHRAGHRTAWGGAVWRLLKEEKATGAVGTLGVSVQSPDELGAALRDPDVGHVQLPFNLLDHRWGEAGADASLAVRPDVVVHVRSALLQGLLTGAPASIWPAIPGVDAADLRTRLLQAVARFDRLNMIDLCLAHVRSMSWVDGIVVGAETIAQLEELAACFARPPLTAAENATLREILPRVPEALLNPALWSSFRPAPAGVAGA
jgi:aryl-alcohol dehydrogenase-like predicted oxidoreductase